MVGPVVATTPPNTAQQADAKFFAKNQVVNERIFSQKNDYDRILSQVKFKLPIDTVIANGDWKLGLNVDANGRMLKSFIGRDFSLGNHIVSLTSTWGPENGVAWLGSASDSNSIKMDVKAVETDGKLSLVFTANDWESKIRTIVLKDGEQPEFIFNNGVKDTTDKGCIVEFSNVQKSGDNINLTARLVKDYTASGGVVTDEKNKLVFPPNFDLWGLIDASAATQVQNWIDLTVQDTLVATIAHWGSKLTFTTETFYNVLKADITNNYKYDKSKHEYWARYVYENGKFDGEMSGAFYELGMRKDGKTLRVPHSYARFTRAGSPQNPDTTSYVLGDLDNATATPIGLGGAPSSQTNVFGSLWLNSEAGRYFALQKGTRVLKEQDSAVGFCIMRTPNDDPNGRWALRYGVLEFGAVVYKTGVSYQINIERTDTVFTADYNLRVRKVSERHIVIEDINPESMKGDKFYTPQTALTPYERSQDTTDVIDPIAHSSVLKVYPNPAHDQLTVEVSGQGHTWVNLTDIYGRVVKNVYNGEVEGNESFPLNTSDLSSGIYFLQVRGTNKAEEIKVEIIR